MTNINEVQRHLHEKAEEIEPGGGACNGPGADTSRKKPGDLVLVKSGRALIAKANAELDRGLVDEPDAPDGDAGTMPMAVLFDGASLIRL